VATFAPVDSARAAADTSSADEFRLERLAAIGSASSLYRLVPEDTTRACAREPVIHYVIADRIDIEMEDGEIDRMDVTGQTRGVHAEPGACVPADSAAADSVVARARRVAPGGPVATRAAAPPFTPARAPWARPERRRRAGEARA
jgi:hypothetical protein